MELKKERTFGELINDSFLFVSQNFIGIFKPLLLFAGPLALLSAFFYSKIEVSFLTNAEYGNASINNILYIVSLLLANIILYGVVYGYVYFYIKQGKDNFTVEDLWKYTIHYLGKISGALLFMIVFVVIGLFLFIIPGVYLIVAFMFLIAIMLYENIDYQFAFLRCLMMIKGRWWKSFGLLLLVNAIILVFGMILKIPELVYTFMLKTAMIKQFSSLPLQYSIVATITQFIVFFLQVFPQITVIFLYFSINESRTKQETVKPETLI